MKVRLIAPVQCRIGQVAHTCTHPPCRCRIPDTYAKIERHSVSSLPCRQSRVGRLEVIRTESAQVHTVVLETDINEPHIHSYSQVPFAYAVTVSVLRVQCLVGE